MDDILRVGQVKASGQDFVICSVFSFWVCYYVDCRQQTQADSTVVRFQFFSASDFGDAQHLEFRFRDSDLIMPETVFVLHPKT